VFGDVLSGGEGEGEVEGKDEVENGRKL